jgi:hypothetical protein
MTVDEIQERIYELVDKLNAHIPLWAKAKADHNYVTDMKLVVLNLEKKKSDKKTGTARDEDAYVSDDYKKYLWKAFEVDCDFYTKDGIKTILEKELDAMRSLLSYEKYVNEATK